MGTPLPRHRFFMFVILSEGVADTAVEGPAALFYLVILSEAAHISEQRSRRTCGAFLSCHPERSCSHQ
jgi:hypothetical protein